VSRFSVAASTEIEGCAASEAVAREPRRRARLARLLADQALTGPLSPTLLALADRLAIDPADVVTDAMAWHSVALTRLAPAVRIDRRLAAFNRLVDEIAGAADGDERPAVLSLPR
jgi:hypothetical protein